MWRLFRRDPEDELEDDDEIGFEDEHEERPPPEVPDFAVIVSASATKGWHMAAVIGQTENPDFYVRAIAVRWPYLMARPARSNRISDRPVSRALLSPAGSTPARKLVVNWAWVAVEDSVSQLRFYVKRTSPHPFRRQGVLKVRLTLKESGWSRRRLVVTVKSNSINWDSPSRPGTGTPPEQ